MNLANCYVTIATIHDGSTLEISFFFFLRDKNVVSLSLEKKCGKSTRILHLKKDLALFCFKYHSAEKRCGCFLHCIGRVS